MANVILVALLILVAVLAFRSSVKHFRGEGGCCGGGGGDVRTRDVPEKQLEGRKLGEKIVSISGMHCDHCAASVAKAINGIEGASARVSLKRNRAVVSYDRDISDERIKRAVEAAGFQVTEIS